MKKKSVLHRFRLESLVGYWVGKPFHCTGLNMGWKAFLLYRFAHGLESLFTAQVCTWAGKPFYCVGLHIGWKAFLLVRSARQLESLLTA